jgi:hypothetical protein
MLTVLGVLLVAVLALEFGLRWADDVPLLSRKNFVRERVDLLMVNVLARYDALLGWTVVPNFRTGDPVFTFSTDQHGMRLPSEQDRPVPPGAILASGDSFTVGAEVVDGYSWPALLEKMLGIPIANAASGAWGGDQIVMRAEQMLDVIRPSTVIISFLWHDILRAQYSIYGGAHKPYFTIKDGVLEHHNNPVPHFTASPDEVGIWRAVFGYSYLVMCAARKFGFSKWYALWDLQYRVAMSQEAGAEVCCLLLERLKAQTDARGMRLLFMMQYGGGDFGTPAAPELATRVSDAARAAGIETIDPWEAMKRMFEEDNARFRSLYVLQPDGKTLGHMSPAGNQYVADLLAPALMGITAQQPATPMPAGAPTPGQ